MGELIFDKNADPSTYQKNSTMSTVFSLLNSMIGGTMLFLPLYFNSTGLIMSSIVMIIMGIISYKGCDIYVNHLKSNEFDIQEIIQRIMGRRWRLFFIAISTVYLILAVLLYYSFSIEMIYSVITFFMQKNGNTDFASKSDVTFSQFSIQYMTLITIPIFLGLLFLKNLRVLIKIAELGVYAIYSYIIFILYTFISNCTSGTLSENIDKTHLWSFDIGQLASTATLAFQIQTNACPMVKCHKDQSKNRFAIKMSYVIGTFLYLVIGVVGGLGILGRVSVQRPDALNINDFFEVDAWQPLLVEVLYLIHLVSMYPILFNICRTRVFEIFFFEDGGKPPRWIFVLSNVLMLALCAVIKIINISPNTLVDLNGAISCFFIVYLIPSLLHLACYHGSNKFLLSVRGKFASQVSDNNSLRHKLKNYSDDDDEIDIIEPENEIQFKNENKNLRRFAVSCNSHTDEIRGINTNLRYTLYIFIISIGLVIFFYGIYSAISQIVQ